MNNSFEDFKRLHRPRVYTEDVGAVDMDDQMPLATLISDLKNIQDSVVPVGKVGYRHMGTHVYFDDMYNNLEIFNKFAETDTAYAKRIYEEWKEEEQRIELMLKAREEKMHSDYEKIKETELEMLYKLAHKYKKEIK